MAARWTAGGGDLTRVDTANGPRPDVAARCRCAAEGTPRPPLEGGAPLTRRGHSGTGSAGEGVQAFRGAEAGRAVVARLGGAEVARGAGAVVAGGHVVEGGGVLVGVLGRVVAAARGAREGVHRRDDGGRGAGAAVGVPARAVRAVGVVDGDTGGGVGHGGDVGDHALGAAGVGLPGGLGVVRGAARAGALGGAGLPDALGPAAGVGGRGQLGAADRGDVLGGGRVFGAVALVAGGDGDGDAGVVEVRGVVGGVRGGLGAAVGVGDELGAQGDGLVDRLAQVGHARRTRLDQQDLGVRGDGGDHVEVEGDLTGPAAVGGGQGGRGAGLGDLLEAAVGGRAGRQAVVAAVGGQVRGGVGVVVGVDDGDGLAGAVGGGCVGQAVGVLEVARAVAGRARGGGVRLERLGGHALQRGLLLHERGGATGDAQGVAGGVALLGGGVTRALVLHMGLGDGGGDGLGAHVVGRGSGRVDGGAESGEDEGGGGHGGGAGPAPSAGYVGGTGSTQRTAS